MTQTTKTPQSLNHITLALVLLLVVASCTEKKPDQNLQKAFDIHTEAMKVREQADQKLHALMEKTDSAFVATYGSKLDSLHSLIEEWDHQVIEVPGFEHDHGDHNHGHDHHHHHHDHGAELDLSPAEHLEVQELLLNEIKSLKTAVDQIPG